MTKIPMFDDPVRSLVPHFVIPTPYQVRGKLQSEFSNLDGFWTPVFTGVTDGGLFTKRS